MKSKKLTIRDLKLAWRYRAMMLYETQKGKAFDFEKATMQDYFILFYNIVTLNNPEHDISVETFEALLDDDVTNWKYLNDWLNGIFAFNATDKKKEASK